MSCEAVVMKRLPALFSFFPLPQNAVKLIQTGGPLQTSVEDRGSGDFTPPAAAAATAAAATAAANAAATTAIAAAAAATAAGRRRGRWRKSAGVHAVPPSWAFVVPHGGILPRLVACCPAWWLGWPARRRLQGGKPPQQQYISVCTSCISMWHEHTHPLTDRQTRTE